MFVHALAVVGLYLMLLLVGYSLMGMLIQNKVSDLILLVVATAGIIGILYLHDKFMPSSDLVELLLFVSAGGLFVVTVFVWYQTVCWKRKCVRTANQRLREQAGYGGVE